MPAYGFLVCADTERGGHARGIRGTWTDSNMQGGPVGEHLDVAVERSTFDQLEGEAVVQQFRALLAPSWFGCLDLWNWEVDA